MVRHLRTIFVSTGVFTVVVWFLNRDFGLNLLTEYLGVCFTVLVLDSMFKQAEAQRLRPLMEVIGKDVGRLRGKCVHLLVYALQSGLSADEAEGLDRSKGFGGETAYAALKNVDMVARVNVLNAPVAMAKRPPYSADCYLTWREYVAAEGRSIAEQADRFVERYSTIAPPAVIAAVRELRGAYFFQATVDQPYLLQLSRSAHQLFQSLADVLPTLTAAIQASPTVSATAGEVDQEAILAAVTDHIANQPWRSEAAPHRPPPPN